VSRGRFVCHAFATSDVLFAVPEPFFPVLRLKLWTYIYI